MTRRTLFYLSLIFIAGSFSPYIQIVLAGPKSTNFELQDYQFSPAGSDTTFSSSNFSLFGSAGEVESGLLNSTNFQSGNGLIYLLQSAAPPAPTLSNHDATYYDKLQLIINYSSSYASIPSDILFAIAFSTDFSNPALTQYVQADHTLSGSPVWQSYTTWGGASGFNVIGLTSNTIYYSKVAAKQGNFTQTGFGPANTPGVPTAAPVTLSFNLRTVSLSSPPFTIGFGNLTPGSVSSTTDQGKVTITTNSNSGALVYVYGTNSGLKSPSQGNYTISSVSSSGQNLSGLTQGYGLRGTSVSQSSGTMVISQPYNGSGNIVGPIDTTERILFTTNDAPVTSGTGQFEIQAKASLTAPPASDYSDTLTVIAAGTF